MKTKRSMFMIVAVMAMAFSGVVASADGTAGDGGWNDPSEYYAALQREARAATNEAFSSFAGAYAAGDGGWNDPSEYYAALQREARAAANEAVPSFAGSYGALRLAASEAGTYAVSAGNWNDPSEYYAALQREANSAAEIDACEVC